MKGEVRLRIRGLMPEKLLERAMDMGVRFARVRPGRGHTLVVDVSAGDARKLVRLCGRFSIPVEVISRRGRSALRRWLKRRWTLGIGLIAALMVCWLGLGRIWRIDVRFTGDAADRGDKSTFIELLEVRGIRPGANRDIDTAMLAEELLAGAGDYSYVGARVQGVVLQIEAAPGFAYMRFNRPELLQLFAEAATAIRGRETRAQLVDRKPRQQVNRSLDELRAFKEVHFIES